MNRYILLLTFCILPFALSAQDWRWIQSGGSLDQVTNPNDEEVVDMATDPNGNVYVLSLVNEGSLKVASMNKQTYGVSDIMLASFGCNGSLRWAKVIGGPKSDYPRALAVDKSGGVYIAAAIALFGGGSFTGNIDADATIPQGDKILYLIKYDTSGSFQWYRSPQADTVTTASIPSTYSIDMTVEPNGNLHWLCQLSKGVFGGTGGFAANNTGQYFLKYNASGNFLGGFKPDIEFAGSSATGAKVVIDAKTSRYYVAGNAGLSASVLKVGGAPLTGSMYIICLNSSGQVVWYRQNTDNNDWAPGFSGRPALDNDGNIYLTGYGYPEALGKQAVVFNGYKVEDNTSNSGRPVVFALDQNGNTIWATSAVGVSAATGGTNVVVRNSGEVFMVGSFTGSMKWPYYNTSYNLPGANYKLLITRFNTQTGKILGMDTIVSSGLTKAYPSAIAADGRNSVFVGGYFEGSITKGGNTVTKNGGPVDWFVTKYGYNCNCNNIPEPKFTFSRTGQKDISFTYTGTGQTSMEWDFGDGATSTQTSPAHSYSTNSFYQACVKVSNACGDNIYCQNIFLWPQGTQELQTAGGNIQVYPNPATDMLTIEGAKEGTRITMLNIMGQQVYSGVISNPKQTISTASLAPGNYIIQLTDTDGNRNTIKIQKQ